MHCTLAALASESGHPGRPNEDWASVAVPASGLGGCLVVLDGVTPPPGDDGCAHGVPWFTARLGGTLIELSGSRRDIRLSEILALSIRRTADAHRNGCDLSHVRTPQATVVVARWDERWVEHLVLSDSTLLLESPDGAVSAVRDDRLDRIPRETLRSPSATDALRNQEDGFFTAAADPAVADRAVTGRTPRSRVKALAALTDGASRWTDLFEAGGWPELMGLLRAEGPQGLIGRVRALERADADRDPGANAVRGGTRVGARRSKVHDDATAGYVLL
ncbi:protein phosphatase 2C domain-containing protein [Streptomyces sp. NPDC127084]|uniref:protein phosphatase 2C domain-containing protein n=1 Tax=Streptomyces sp. NPDC127084 TaxID=3347133 RepID=UPI00365A8D35